MRESRASHHVLLKTEGDRSGAALSVQGVLPQGPESGSYTAGTFSQHNGSVPSLWGAPAAGGAAAEGVLRRQSGDRPGQRRAGHRQLPGSLPVRHHRARHTTLTDAEKWDLVEYLKSL
jgi:hypothetical protein